MGFNAQRVSSYLRINALFLGPLRNEMLGNVNMFIVLNERIQYFTLKFSPSSFNRLFKLLGSYNNDQANSFLLIYLNLALQNSC